MADVYDALVSKRVYKEAFTHDVARHIILDGSGTQFDPDVVSAFVRCDAEFQAIARNVSLEDVKEAFAEAACK